MSRLISMFDIPVIQNNLRGLYVEAMVAGNLSAKWKSVGSDWRAWDLQHEDGTRLEVKQSAAHQSWSEKIGGVASARFRIEASKQPWDGTRYIAGGGRMANIYVFAWHDGLAKKPDHRVPEQWVFYVVSEAKLPHQKSIGLSPLRKIVQPISASNLDDAVEAIRKKGV
ncbi:MAG: hypothetical protein KDK24_16855 [Pseudooceanicola sp.]|nr:hypothetical protein [Pseudooceanicola sp.]